ncbi:MAG: cytochrome c biogenesis protein ResB [Elusimicrobia bacterium]|nr:cytochrome c biogenesis protein ResB [Elusimicrobiota bacterium]
MRLLVSTRFNVGLFLFFSAVCALGSVVPQEPDSAQAAARFLEAWPRLGGLLSASGCFDLYHSWWFAALLGLLALDVALCKLRRPPPGSDPWEGLLGGPRAGGDAAALDLARPELRKKSLYAVCDRAGGGEGIGRLLEGFAAEGWRLSPVAEAPGAVEAGGRASEAPSGALAWVADRGSAQRWGSLVSHAAIVVVFAAGLAGRLLGFSEMIEVSEGRTAPMRHRPWTIALDRFTVEHYEKDGRPKLFASELRIMDGPLEVGRKRVVVNDPLDVGGVRFYQSSWGVAEDFAAVKISAAGEERVLRPGVEARLPGTRASVTAERFMPDFDVVDGRPANKSSEAIHPALRVRLKRPGKPAETLWVLNDMPDAALAEGPDGSVEAAPPPPFRVLGVQPRLFSGIEVGYDPGYRFMLAGFGAWVAGLVLLFGVHRRRVWVVCSESDGALRCELAGWSLRGDHAFHAEFDRLAGRARSALASAGAAVEGGGRGGA